MEFKNRRAVLGMQLKINLKKNHNKMSDITNIHVLALVSVIGAYRILSYQVYLDFM